MTSKSTKLTYFSSAVFVLFAFCCCVSSKNFQQHSPTDVKSSQFHEEDDEDGGLFHGGDLKTTRKWNSICFAFEKPFNCLTIWRMNFETLNFLVFNFSLLIISSEFYSPYQFLRDVYRKIRGKCIAMKLKLFCTWKKS